MSMFFAHHWAALTRISINSSPSSGSAKSLTLSWTFSIARGPAWTIDRAHRSEACSYSASTLQMVSLVIVSGFERQFAGALPSEVATAGRPRRITNTGLYQPLHPPQAESLAERMTCPSPRTCIRSPLWLPPNAKTWALQHIVPAQMLASCQSTQFSWQGKRGQRCPPGASTGNRWFKHSNCP